MVALRMGLAQFLVVGLQGRGGPEWGGSIVGEGEEGATLAAGGVAWGRRAGPCGGRPG